MDDEDNLQRRLETSEEEKSDLQATLHDQEDRYRFLFEAIDEGFCIIQMIEDASGRPIDYRFLEVNPAFERQTGLADALGRTVREMVPDLEQHWFETYGRIAATRIPERFEYRADALGRWYDVYAFPIGEPSELRVAILFRDVIERKRIEVALREREADLARVQRIGRVGGLDIDLANGMRSRRSPEYLRLHGLPLDNRDETHSEWLSRVHPDDRVRANQTLLDALKGDAKTYANEYRIIRPNDGVVRWIEARADIERNIDGRAVRLVGAHVDITEQKLAQLALFESQERQAFLLRLGDNLRAQRSADAVGELAVKMVSEELKVERCYVATRNLREDRADIPYQARSAGLPLLPTAIRMSDAPATVQGVFEQPLIFNDIASEPGLTDLDRQFFEALGFAALLTTPLPQGEQNSIWSLGVVSTKPRRWSPGEIALVGEVAERIWSAIERSRNETALRDSEMRFRQFAKASSSALWIRDAQTFAMEYVSPAIENIYGVQPQAFIGDVKLWASAIIPEDRQIAIEHLERAGHGEAVVHEFRIQRGSDAAFRWIRNIEFPLLDDYGRVQRIGGIAEDVTETKLAVEHQGVLLAELQHRVRNIMAIIHSITARTGDRAASASEYARLMSGRLLALARVQALLTRAANAGVGIATIVRDEMSAQAHHEGQYELDGQDVELSPKTAEVITLAIHELATNALKYGALSVPNGKIVVRWSAFEKRGRTWLGLDWMEKGAPEGALLVADAPRRRGFGTELIEDRIPYELGGKGSVIIDHGGARCHLEFPLQHGASILETDAPKRATVFGGALDMAGEEDLSGHRILVVEDDYYLATDTARALRGAGAQVIGPCGNELAARDAIEGERPTGAVVDINLGSGASFDLARMLRDQAVPIVFVSGYDQQAIPAEFNSIVRLQKPIELRQIVDAVAHAVGVTTR